MVVSIFRTLLALSLGSLGSMVVALQPPTSPPPPARNPSTSRRDALGWFLATGTVMHGMVPPAWGAGSAVQDSLNVDSFLRTGVDPGGNMGVSSQAGKSKPETGVFFRDGSDVLRDPRTGDVLAEILLKNTEGSPMAALVSFASPWPLATGTYFDIECRNPQGDGAFVAVTTPVKNGQSIQDIKDSFFLDNLLSPTGRFSFYGPPTDVKVKKSVQKDGYRFIDLSFATLSQSTQTEIPRRAQLVATIPSGSSQAVMLVGSASASRWTKGADQNVYSTVQSFRAVAAPQTSLKLRIKPRPQNPSLEAS